MSASKHFFTYIENGRANYHRGSDPTYYRTDYAKSKARKI